MQSGKQCFFTTRNMFEIMETAMEKYNTNSTALDVKKVQV